MRTLGFTNEYYTLWEVSEPYPVFTSSHNFYYRVDFSYLQNLSKDYASAVAKIKKIGAYREDLKLKGTGSFFSAGKPQDNYGHERIGFGSCEGMLISECENEWQLNRLRVGGYDSFWSGDGLEPVRPLFSLAIRRSAHARARMLELGFLFKFEGVFMTRIELSDMNIADRKTRYAEHERLIAGHHFQDGKRIELLIRKTDGFSFMSDYGETFVEKYITSDGKGVKYMGSKASIISKTEYTKIMATIAHSEYNGVSETKIKRIKVCA